jgi:hypothetical protein
MEKMIICVSHTMKNGILDDDYTLYDDGTILHEYDKHIYPGGQDLKENLTVDDLSQHIKQRLYDAASNENKILVYKVLKLS